MYVGDWGLILGKKGFNRLGNTTSYIPRGLAEGVEAIRFLVVKVDPGVAEKHFSRHSNAADRASPAGFPPYGVLLRQMKYIP